VRARRGSTAHTPSQWRGGRGKECRAVRNRWFLQDESAGKSRARCWRGYVTPRSSAFSGRATHEVIGARRSRRQRGMPTPSQALCRHRPKMAAALHYAHVCAGVRSASSGAQRVCGSVSADKRDFRSAAARRFMNEGRARQVMRGRRLMPAGAQCTSAHECAYEAQRPRCAWQRRAYEAAQARPSLSRGSGASFTRSAEVYEV